MLSRVLLTDNSDSSSTVNSPPYQTSVIIIDQFLKQCRPRRFVEMRLLCLAINSFVSHFINISCHCLSLMMLPSTCSSVCVLVYNFKSFTNWNTKKSGGSWESLLICTIGPTVKMLLCKFHSFFIKRSIPFSFPTPLLQLSPPRLQTCSRWQMGLHQAPQLKLIHKRLLYFLTKKCV